MLLGCCHCGETPPSESTPPSVSESASSSDPAPISEVTNNCARENCTGSVFARRYKLTFAYNQTARCGPRYSAQTYMLEFFSAAGDFCAFRSAELGVNWSGGVCVDGIRLATLGLYNDGLSVPSGADSVRYIVGIYAQEAGANRFIYYGSNLGNVSILSGAPYSPINCLTGFSLPLTSGTTAVNNFHTTVTGLGGGVAAVPTSVGLEPA